MGRIGAVLGDGTDQCGAAGRSAAVGCRKDQMARMDDGDMGATVMREESGMGFLW